MQSKFQDSQGYSEKPCLKKQNKQTNNKIKRKGYLASSELNSPTIVSPGYTITREKQDSDLKSLLMMMIEDFKKDINNSIKEI